jgi:hypothetical protein
MTTPGVLHFSRDRKVAPKGYWGGMHKGKDRGWVASIANSFGLPAGTSCPGQTPFCVSCYAVNAENYSPAVKAAMAHNLALLLDCRGNIDAMAALLDVGVTAFERAFDKTGLPEADRVFRIHWDGDFFDENYALAWRQVMLAHPDIAFWTYTRSFTPPVDVVPILAGVENLALYLSTDEFNWQRAHDVASRFDVRLALCGIDFRTAREMALDSPGPAPRVCPENRGTLPLMDDNGRGACVECRLCIRGTADIIFATSKREDLLHGQGRLFPTGNLTVPVAIRSRRKALA